MPARTRSIKRGFVGACAALLALLCVEAVRAGDATMETYGVCSKVNRYADYLDECDEIIASGIKWVRLSPEWKLIEPADGDYDDDYLAKLDAIVDRLTDHGVNILFTIAYTPQWASSMPNDPQYSRYKRADWSDWEDFVTFITTHYDGEITHWEMWNEPDHPSFWQSSVQDYATLLKRGAAKARQANANDVVAMAGLSAGTNGLGTFFDIMMSYVSPTDFDIGNGSDGSVEYVDMVEVERLSLTQSGPELIAGPEPIEAAATATSTRPRSKPVRRRPWSRK